MLKRIMTVTAHCFFCLYFACGCSLFAPHHEELTIVTIPPGAKVDIEGSHFVSPVKTQIRKGHSFAIYVEMPGYVSQKAWCGRTISTTGVLDLAGTMLFYLPAIGFFSPGVWKLEQTYYKFFLKPSDP